MLKSQELADPNSCWNKAADDEPLFVLRANDETAPSIIWFWATEYIRSKGGKLNEHGDIVGLTPEQREKHKDAVIALEEFQRWKAKQLAKEKA